MQHFQEFPISKKVTGILGNFQSLMSSNLLLLLISFQLNLSVSQAPDASAAKKLRQQTAFFKSLIKQCETRSKTAL